MVVPPVIDESRTFYSLCGESGTLQQNCKIVVGELEGLKLGVRLISGESLYAGVRPQRAERQGNIECLHGCALDGAAGDVTQLGIIEHDQVLSIFLVVHIVRSFHNQSVGIECSAEVFAV